LELKTELYSTVSSYHGEKIGAAACPLKKDKKLFIIPSPCQTEPFTWQFSQMLTYMVNTGSEKWSGFSGSLGVTKS